MLITVALTLGVFFLYSFPKSKIIYNRHNNNVLLTVLWFFVSINIYMTSSLSIDMTRYLNNLEVYSKWSFTELSLLETTEPLFYSLTWFISNIVFSPSFFRVAIWLVISVLMLIALKKVFLPQHILLVSFSYFTYFIFHNFTTNILRQGIAANILLVALSMLMNKRGNKLSFYFLIITAPLFHNSAAVFSLTLLIIKYVKKIKYMYYTWLLFAIMYIFRLNSVFFSRLAPYVTYIEEYSSSSLLNHYNGTNRIDFLFFSAILVLWCWFAAKYILKENESYSVLIKFYLLANSIFLAGGFLAFSDRLAAYSWNLAPLLIWYPIFYTNNKSVKRYRLVYLYFALLFFIVLSVVNWENNLLLLK